jgi:YVTN family beta-propeller protein
VQAFDTTPGAMRLRVIVPTRGDPSIAWADYDGSKLTCGGSPPFPLCDDEHRLSSIHNDPNLPIPDEPFSVFADKVNGFAVVSHLTTGAITLLDAPDRSCAGCVQVADVIAGVFAQDPLTGLVGATGVAGHAPASAGDPDLVYVGSRSENRIQTFSVGRPVNQAPPYLLPASYFFLTAVGDGVGASSDTRGMQLSADGNHLYVVNRRPPNLQVVDTSIDPMTARPRNVVTGASDICRQASTVAVRDFAADDQRAYVTCFQDGQVYVIDPRGQSHVEDIITVGRGPYAVAAAADPRQRLFISNFLEDTIAVVDVDPASATRNRVVLRIGEPRKP